MCGFPPSFSQKEKSHVHSVTRPGRGSIATSWPPVWSKVNIWREATVQAGTWGLCKLLSFALPPPFFFTSPPLYLLLAHWWAMLPWGLETARGCCFWIQLAGRLGPVRWSPSWDWLSRESLLRWPGWSCLPAMVWLVYEHCRITDRDKPAQVYLICINMNREHKGHLPHCVSYREYVFHLQLCMSARFILVPAVVLCGRRGKVCCRFAVKSGGQRARSAACSLLSLMAGDSFNWDWGAVCTAQFCPH